jgi:uncharacterized protein (DUF488 family)
VNTVYTIGYEGTDIDRFVVTLQNVGVRAVADVRAVAVSRKKGFSKSRLRERLEEVGIRYVHFVELGDPKPGRDAARAGRYAEFRKIYSRHLAGEVPQEKALALSKLARQMPTCLLCFERDAATCHRSMIADQLASSGFEIQNLLGDKPGQYDPKKMSCCNTRQGATAA